MRVLVASTAFPLPRTSGLDLLVAGVLRGLAADHDITLVTMVDDSSDLTRALEVCHRVVPVHPPRGGLWGRVHQELATLPTRRPVLAEQVTEALAGPLRDAAAEHRPELLHLFQAWTAELVDCVPGVPSVLSAIDATGPNWQARIASRSHPVGRALSRRELARMLRFERAVYPRLDRVVVVTEQDAALVRAQSPASQVRVIGNGIDLDPWARPPGADPEPGLVVFSGALSYPPNVAAALLAVDEVLPRLRERVPGARLRLVGRDPAPELLARAGPHVEVTGTVPEVAPHLWAAAAYLCPMTAGSGVKNKLLEALAAGAPSVVTTLATAGLGLVDGRDALVRDTPEGLADALAEVLTDPALARRLSAGALGRAGALSWDGVAQAYDRVYAEVRGERSA